MVLKKGPEPRTVRFQDPFFRDLGTAPEPRTTANMLFQGLSMKEDGIAMCMAQHIFQFSFGSLSQY